MIQSKASGGPAPGGGQTSVAMNRILIMLLGVAAPLVPRAARGDFARWAADWSAWILGRPRDFVVGWLWFLLPFAVLAAFASLGRGWGGRIAAVVLFALGIWCSVPVPGHGYRFYLGEAVFPIVAAVALPASLLLGYFAERIAAGRPQATGRSELR